VFLSRLKTVFIFILYFEFGLQKSLGRLSFLKQPKASVGA